MTAEGKSVTVRMKECEHDRYLAILRGSHLGIHGHYGGYYVWTISQAIRYALEFTAQHLERENSPDKTAEYTSANDDSLEIPKKNRKAALASKKRGG